MSTIINPNSVKTIVLDSTRSSSNTSGLRQFNFPTSKLSKDGYFKVTSVFIKGTLPTSAYLKKVLYRYELLQVAIKGVIEVQNALNSRSKI